MNNAISWFEIGTTDLDRATKFYETIFGIKLNPLDLEDMISNYKEVEQWIIENGYSKYLNS